VIDTDIAAASS